jgi:hypothetical protein
MMLSPVPLLHGALGWWDEILCLIPTLLLIGLAYYIYRSDRDQKAQTGEPTESDEKTT